jgi:hypothetical protein
MKRKREKRKRKRKKGHTEHGREWIEIVIDREERDREEGAEKRRERGVKEIGTMRGTKAKL